MPNHRLLQAGGLVNRRLEAEDSSDSLVVDDSDLVRLAEDCSANSGKWNTNRIHEQRASAREIGNSARYFSISHGPQEQSRNELQ